MPLDDYKSKLARRRVSTRVLLDQSIVAEHAAADAALRDALASDEGSIGEPDHITALRLEVERLEQQMHDAETEFVFVGIGRQAWLALLADHPPTDEQRADGNDHDPTTFLPAAIAASCVTPDDVDLDVAEWLAAELDLAEWGKLWAACLEANLGVSARPKSVAASVLRRTSAASSSTAPLEGSLAASS